MVCRLILRRGRDGSPARAAVAGLRGSLAGVDGWLGASGRGRDDHDPAERFEDLISPRPAPGQPEPSSPAAPAESGGDVQHPEPQQLGFDDGQVAGQREQPEPGGQVGGNGHQLQPGLVDLEFSRRESAEAAVSGGPDPVLHAGVSAVPGLEEPELPGNGVVAKAW